jgi:exodeoxyribonuclease-3
MRIATFNINNVVRRLPNLIAWLADTAPDVVCLQELKAADAAFPAAAIEAAGYGAVWAGQRTWNGVAILARDAAPIVTRYELPRDPADTQARYIEAAVRGVLVASIYAPNGNPNPGPKFDYKLRWLQRLTAHAKALLAEGVPVALAGDYNVVPTEADIYQPNSWQGDALVDPAARTAFRRLVAQGWIDALLATSPIAPSSTVARSSPVAKTTGEGDHRAPRGGGGGGGGGAKADRERARQAPDGGATTASAGANGAPWTFWSYLRRRWENDHGLRIDHILLSPTLAPRLTAAGVDKPVRGEPGASDHAPSWVELAE